MDRIYQISAGLDVHKKIVVCSIAKVVDSQIVLETKSFTTFHTELIELAKWLKSNSVEIAIMESTSVYWYPVYEALEDEDISAMVVNAQHVKTVPGRKTDVRDSEWLSQLGLHGLLSPSLVPKRDIRELRVVMRYRSKLVGMISSEKTRMGKYLDAAGIKLGSIVSSIDGVAAQNLIDALLRDVLTPANLQSFLPKKARLKASIEDLARATQGRLSTRHRMVLNEIKAHLEYLSKAICRLDDEVIGGMAPYTKQYELLQTMPGVDKLSAAMLIIETGGDMKAFKNRDSFSAWAGVAPSNNESAGKKKVTHTQSK